MNPNELSSLTLAYLGDSIYELYIRHFLIQKGIVKPNDLQANAVSYVSAKAQCQFLQQLLEKDFFSAEELMIIKRARNHKTNSYPKHTSLITYKYATGLEALIGFLYLEKKDDRIRQIMQQIVGE